MVQLANPGKVRRHADTPPKSAAASTPSTTAVKTEIEDPLEEEHGPLNKRSRNPANFQQWAEDAVRVPSHTMQCRLLDEPSPLGLSLRKSPSFLDLIQMRLSQGSSNALSCTTSSGAFEIGKKKDLKSVAVSGISDKMKASNFPVSLLKIGSWECVSRYEGDLVAKCYYAKHKLVWEVLDGGLKNKIEIQWADIAALKATCPENGPGTLDIMLARQPLFFRETNPQPRKHTLWQSTSDFTKGQASLNRRHYLQCPQGLLIKHFEKLVQCDPRLNSLSLRPENVLDSPYFELRCSVFEDQDKSKCHGFDDLKDGYGSNISGFTDYGSPCAAPSTSDKNDFMFPVGETLSPSSVMDARIIKDPTTVRKDSDGCIQCDRIKVPGLRSSVSVSDLVNHLRDCISGHTTPCNPLMRTEDSLNKDVLEALTHHLLSDSQVASASDEQSLMSRVNSLCCLIQKDPSSSARNNAAGSDEDDDGGFECKPHPADISRKEYDSELLMHLPRIASFPQFVFNNVKDSRNQAR